MKLGEPSGLKLGNLDAVRDWGHARDYVRAMPLILRAPELKEYVIATGVSRTIRDLILTAEKVIDRQVPFEIDAAFIRPRETVPLRADPSRAMAELGWKPEIGFEALIQEMIEAKTGTL